MQKQELQTSLTRLHQELATVDNVDESTKEMLATVMQDIEKLLAGRSDSASGEVASASGRTTEQPHSDSLRDLVTEFEAEHPKLAQALGRLADGLANLGI